MKTSSVAVIIVAGGSGLRMGGTLPKQFMPLDDGRPILMHTLERMAQALPDAQMIVVLAEAHVARWRSLCAEHGCTIAHTLRIGGSTRFESVRNGIEAAASAEWIAVHDGVRPIIVMKEKWKDVKISSVDVLGVRRIRKG